VRPAAHAAALPALADSALGAVGHKIGPAHVELRFPAGGPPMIIEINPRLAGGLIPRLVRHATGRDLVDEVVTAAAGLRPANTLPGKGFASIRFLIPARDGRVADVSGLDAARRVPGVAEMECRIDRDAEVELENSFVDRKGHVIGASRRSAEAIAATERAIDHIRINYADELVA
jgi:S-sulfo-L-cysteine synthase (3-phospho-L-serine-dependent)